ncbi:MAG TPA: hypothetical protein VLF67_01175 [Candidatus Saccharimonas sp.]|nr:hypothetical protein [Candidatus Saccharimonas sp.]
MDRDEIARKRAELNAQAAVLDAEEARQAALTPEQRVAELLHRQLCRWNHTDSCGWHYGSWDRPLDPRDEYLAKAKAVLAAAGGNEALVTAVLAAMGTGL